MELSQRDFDVATHLESWTVSIDQPSDSMVFGYNMIVINFNQIDELIKLLEQAKYAIDMAHFLDPVPTVRPKLSVVK